MNDPQFRQLILEGTTAFWNAYLLDDAKALAWFKEDEFARSVRDGGVFEAQSPGPAASTQ